MTSDRFARDVQRINRTLEKNRKMSKLEALFDRREADVPFGAQQFQQAARQPVQPPVRQSIPFGPEQFREAARAPRRRVQPLVRPGLPSLGGLQQQQFEQLIQGMPRTPAAREGPTQQQIKNLGGLQLTGTQLGALKDQLSTPEGLPFEQWDALSPAVQQQFTRPGESIRIDPYVDPVNGQRKQRVTLQDSFKGPTWTQPIQAVGQAAEQLATAPLFHVGNVDISATDLVAVALLAYGGYQGVRQLALSKPVQTAVARRFTQAQIKQLETLNNQASEIMQEELSTVLEANPDLAARVSPKTISEIAGGMRDILRASSRYDILTPTRITGMPSRLGNAYSRAAARRYAKFVLEWATPAKSNAAVSILRDAGFKPAAIREMAAPVAWRNMVQHVGLEGLLNLAARAGRLDPFWRSETIRGARAEALAQAGRQEAPIPQATQTGAMTMGGKAAEVPKQPWEMTRAEYIDSARVWRAENMPRLTGAALERELEGVASTHPQIIRNAVATGKPVPPEVLAEYPDLKPAAPAEPTVPAEVAPAAEAPVVPETLPEVPEAPVAAVPEVKPVPSATPQQSLVQRRDAIKELLATPSKELPAGTQKIALRKELKGIQTQLEPAEKKLRQQITANVSTRGLGKTQREEIFKRIGGSRHLSDVSQPELERILSAVKKTRPKKIGNSKVIRPTTEAKIQTTKADLINRNILTEEDYRNILKGLKLKTDKYTDGKSFITESEGSGIIRQMRNAEILDPLGELKFGKPTAAKYLTSQTYYARILGLHKLVAPLELAKVDFDLAYRAMDKAISSKLKEVNAAWGVSASKVAAAKVKNVPTEASVAMRDLLDKNEVAPEGLTDKQKALFDWFRNLNQSMLDGENEVRRAMGVKEIPYRQAYVRHVPDAMAQDIIDNLFPLPPSLEYWSKRLVSKKIFNPMELRRQLSSDLEQLYSKDLGYATRSMVFTGLKEIHLAQPLRAFTERMGALSDVMPAGTQKWATDYINEEIKGRQTDWDAGINSILADSGLGGLINKSLAPFNRTLGRKPITRLARTIGDLNIYSVMALPRPRLARLLVRNLFQRTQELGLHGGSATLQSFLPDPPELKALKARSSYLKGYTGIEEFPTDLLGKLAKIPLAPYQMTAVLNADRAMSASYHDYLKFFEDKKHQDLGWASPERTYQEPKGFLYPEEANDMLDEMELAARATQFGYNGLAMPEIFRNKTLIPLTRFQSWWMNYFMQFHREAFHRFAYGTTRGGHRLPWSSRLNWLKYLVFGGAILTGMGYGGSYLWKVLPHNESPATQLALGLVSYISADSDWQRAKAKRQIFYSWKALAPGALSWDEFEKMWNGEMPLWQMFFYGNEETGPPPRRPDWGLPLGTPVTLRADMDTVVPTLGKPDMYGETITISALRNVLAKDVPKIDPKKLAEYPPIVAFYATSYPMVRDYYNQEAVLRDAYRLTHPKMTDEEIDLALWDAYQEKYPGDTRDDMRRRHRDEYEASHPEVLAYLYFWGRRTKYYGGWIREQVRAWAKEFGVPLESIPAEQRLLPPAGRTQVPREPTSAAEPMSKLEALFKKREAVR